SRGASSDLLHPHEVRDTREHAADLGPVGKVVRRADPPQPERAQRAAVLGLGADLRPDERDSQRVCLRHDYATSVISCFPARSRSRYASGMPFVEPSSADLPRSFATSSGRRSACRPCIVARATLIAFADPSDFASTSWMPADSRIWRAAPPAITPVPGAAGFSITRAASCSPIT